MKILESNKMSVYEKMSGVGLGNFDGVHLAHEHLLKTLVQECSKRNLESIVYTFREHPGNILQNRKIKLISTLEERIEKFESIGIDCLVLQDFNSKFASMEAKNFIGDIIVKKLNAKLVVTGFNYNFGAMGKGNIELLKREGKSAGYETITIEPVKSGDSVISSSAIRGFIKSGMMSETREMLGRYYTIKGKVEYGNRIGTMIGFPTANIIPLQDFALPAAGVYFTRTKIDEKTYDSITNIGFKPTVSKNKHEIIETHIFGFSGWLYGKEIEVKFIKKHRDEIKHKDIEELKSRIEQDIVAAELFFGYDAYL